MDTCCAADCFEPLLHHEFFCDWHWHKLSWVQQQRLELATGAALKVVIWHARESLRIKEEKTC